MENEFLATRRYIDFQESNFKKYSIEFLKLYQAVCSEIDVIGKALASECNSQFRPDDKQNNIYKWWYEIQHKIKYFEVYNDPSRGAIQLNSVEVCLLDEISIVPWEGFKVETYLDKNKALRYRAKKVPDWWNSYNSVKHSRTSYYDDKNSTVCNYTKANLKNVIYAVSALYVLEKAYMESVGTQNELQAFADYSVLFEKIENITQSELEELFS